MLKNPATAFSRRSDHQRTSEGTPPVFSRCGLARGTACLGAPGVGVGEKSGLFEHPDALLTSMPLWKIPTADGA